MSSLEPQSTGQLNLVNVEVQTRPSNKKPETSGVRIVSVFWRSEDRVRSMFLTTACRRRRAPRLLYSPFFFFFFLARFLDPFRRALPFGDKLLGLESSLYMH